jgi:phage tail sheath protein FI
MPNYRSPGVYVEEVPAGARPIEGVGTAIAAFLGVTAKGPYNMPVRVTNWGQYVNTYGDWVPGAYLPLAVYNFFNNGGGACYIVRVGENGDAGHPKATAELTSSVKAGVAVYRVEAREEGTTGDNLSVEVVHTPTAEGGGDGEQQQADDSFTLVVREDGRPIETFENLQTKRGKRQVATVVNEESKLIRVEEVGSSSTPERLPSVGQVALGGGAAIPARVTVDDFMGDAQARRGIGGLEAIDDVTMLATPDLMMAYEQGHIDLDGVQAVQQGLLDHCDNMGDRMAILDPPPGLNAQQVKEWVKEKARYDSKFATLYWPWVQVFDPVAKHSRSMPPSGAIAGIWGRNDDTRGVHKAPANEVIRGALDIDVNVTRAEHDDLNPEGINVIRSFPGRGIRVWGGRTLSSESDWRYVNVRRLFNYIEASILAGTQWVVFEPNDLDLWQRIRRTVGSFLLGLWRDGALFGATPEQAFYVKCDDQTNPPDVIDAGRVVIEIGIAPVKPAEFVVFKIAQLSSGGAVEE